MARILKDREWYEPLSPGAMYESDYEALVGQHADAIFPQFHYVPFKCCVESDYDSAKADFALIHRQYVEWWVGEIELSTHSLSHVERQVRTLSEALYDESTAAYLGRTATHLDSHRIMDLMKGCQPRVVVVVNQPRDDWAHTLTRFDALVTIVEIYRSDRNAYVFRVNGEGPRCGGQHLSECHFDPIIPRFLCVKSPAALPFGPGQKISLYHGDLVTDWERVDCRDQVWLTPVKANPLKKETAYVLLQKEDGTLEITEQKKTLRR